MKNHIRVHRKAQGLTIAALARKLGTSSPQVSRLENGERQLTLKWITKLSKVLAVPVDELVELPFDQPTVTKCDQALLGSLLTWLIEACKVHKVRIDPQSLAKWASYAYNETVEERLNFKQTKKLAFSLVAARKKAS